MTLASAQQELLTKLKNLYDEREAANIANWAMEWLTGKTRIDRMMDKQATLTDVQINRFQSILSDLLTNRPIQYVLGEAWFAGEKFFVNESVLIPRPETEELVEWIVSESEKLKVKSEKLVDIGTGSGCIAVTLKKKIPGLSVTAIDTSKEALAIAQKNALELGTDIEFREINFLEEAQWETLPVFDCIVSNPPYIRASEESNMHNNVLRFEPHLALFVPDDDALLFYRKIVLFAQTHLNPNGFIFLEINEALGNEVIQLFESKGYELELRKDMQGKDRMLKANLKM